MGNAETVSYIMGFVALGIGLFFGGGIFLLYKSVKKTIKNDKNIQQGIKKLAEQHRGEYEETLNKINKLR